jgi:hypothetical protein
VERQSGDAVGLLEYRITHVVLDFEEDGQAVVLNCNHGENDEECAVLIPLLAGIVIARLATSESISRLPDFDRLPDFEMTRNAPIVVLPIGAITGVVLARILKGYLQCGLLPCVSHWRRFTAINSSGLRMDYCCM